VNVIRVIMIILDHKLTVSNVVLVVFSVKHLKFVTSVKMEITELKTNLLVLVIV